MSKMRSDAWMSFGASFLLLGFFSVTAQAKPRAHAAPSSPAEEGSQAFVDQDKFGGGLSWMSLPDTLDPLTSQSGYLSGRYWFGRKFGLEGGMGMGFPRVSPEFNFLLDFNVEPMFALATRRHTIVYSDLALMPSVLTGGSSGTSSWIDISGGVGMEHAMTEIPRFSWYGQWNPISFNIFMPASGTTAGSTALGIGLFGSVMNFSTGFHYYF